MGEGGWGNKGVGGGGDEVLAWGREGLCAAGVLALDAALAAGFGGRGAWGDVGGGWDEFIREVGARCLAAELPVAPAGA